MKQCPLQQLHAEIAQVYATRASGSFESIFQFEWNPTKVQNAQCIFHGYHLYQIYQCVQSCQALSAPSFFGVATSFSMMMLAGSTDSF